MTCRDTKRMSESKDDLKGKGVDAKIPDLRISEDDDFVGDVFPEKVSTHSFEKIEALASGAKGGSPFRSMSGKIDELEDLDDLGDLDDLQDFGLEEKGTEVEPKQSKIEEFSPDPVKADPEANKVPEQPILTEKEAPFGESVLTEVEEKELAEEEVELRHVEKSIPKVAPVRLDPSEVYSENKIPEAAEKLRELAEPESKSNSNSGPESELESDEMEILGPDEGSQHSLSKSPSEQNHKVSKWAFWKRPSKRDEQLSRISDGYLEMVDLVRAIRGQLESQNENNAILRESLSHLPEAMKGLDSFSKSQHTVGEALQEIHGQMQRYSSKDERLADSMEGFNTTLKGMDGTTKATMQTFDRVQERMRDSDIRMENLVQNVQSTEEKVSDTMMRLQKNMAIMQTLFLVCLLLAIGALIYTFVMKNDEGEKLLNEPSKVEQKQDVQVPAEPAEPSQEAQVAPEPSEPAWPVQPVERREPRDIVIPE